MRVKGGTIHRARRKKALKQAKGYFGSKHRLYKTAKEQVMHSDSYAYRDRKARKGDFRKLWITRINAACRLNDISYSKFINGLNKAGIEVNRKMLAEIAVDNEKAFAELVNAAKSALEGKAYKAKEVKAEVKKETKTEVKKEVKKSEKVDLSTKTVAELREMAKAKDISGYSTMKKAELIDSLK
ncbi:MAG: 50S ribosomal protein L20 [Bacilli bacterium]|nr:50S ribosomal protein L20 [Bacilli bacterium]